MRPYVVFEAAGMDPVSSLACLPRAMLLLSWFPRELCAPLTQAFFPYSLAPPPYIRRLNDWRRATYSRILKRCCKIRTLFCTIIETVFQMSNVQQWS